MPDRPPRAQKSAVVYVLSEEVRRVKDMEQEGLMWCGCAVARAYVGALRSGERMREGSRSPIAWLSGVAVRLETRAGARPEGPQRKRRLDHSSTRIALQV